MADNNCAINNDWPNFRKYVLETLKETHTDIKYITTTQLPKLMSRVTALEVKAGIIAIIIASVVSIISTIVTYQFIIPRIYNIQ